MPGIDTFAQTAIIQGSVWELKPVASYHGQLPTSIPLVSIIGRIPGEPSLVLVAPTENADWVLDLNGEMRANFTLEPYPLPDEAFGECIFEYGAERVYLIEIGQNATASVGTFLRIHATNWVTVALEEDDYYSFWSVLGDLTADSDVSPAVDDDDDDLSF